MIRSDFDTDLRKSIEVLEKGGTLLYPTDTVWGIGCDATNETAAAKVYYIKSRVESKSMIILLDAFEKLETYVENVPGITFDLLKSIDNPVTIIYSHARNLAANIVAADGTIAIRIVKEPFCMELIRQFGKPIVSTSANISGEPAPALFNQISDEIKNQVDYIVTYKQNYFERSKPSTIIRLEDSGSYTIIRQ